MLENRIAIVTFAATFLLLLVGGTVNPTGSSLACPEPTFTCEGKWFPEMRGGVLYEHGHRQVAMLVGLLQIALTVVLWRRRPALRSLGVLALVMVCAQGLLGALTVYYKLPWFISTAHLAMAFAYIALLIYIAWRTRPEPGASARGAAGDRGGAGALRRTRAWIAVAAGALLAQVLLGGLIRHAGGALACVDWPLCEGSLWPPGPLALKLHMAHRIGGVLVGLVAIATAVVVWRAARGLWTLRLLAAALPALIVGQVSLGLLVIASYGYVGVTVAHFGGATLLWSMFVAMWLMTGGREPAPLREAKPR